MTKEIYSYKLDFLYREIVLLDKYIVEFYGDCESINIEYNKIMDEIKLYESLILELIIKESEEAHPLWFY